MKRNKKEKQKWLFLEGKDEWRIIIPNTDMLPHSTTSKKDEKNELAWIDCPCKPKINYLDKMIIHNSFKDEDLIKKSMKKII